MSSYTSFSRGVMRAAVTAIMATAVGVPASFAQGAADESDGQSIQVKYADLNLATPEGSLTLYRRLVNAAERVCPRVGTPTELQRNREARSCINAAVQDAAKQIRSSQFAQVAASRMR